MTTITPQERFQIQQFVDDNLDSYIKRVKEAINDSGVYGKNRKYDIMGQSQFSNFSGVVRDTRSIEAVKIWIQYQIGRGRTGWEHNNFGQTIIGIIDDLVKLAKHITDVEELQQALYMTFLRQLAGHMERYFYYRQKTHGGN